MLVSLNDVEIFFFKNFYEKWNLIILVFSLLFKIVLS